MASTSKATTTRAAAEAALGPVDLSRMRRPPSHPGDIFRNVFRIVDGEERISQAEAARRLGWHPVVMNGFERGRRNVTAETAVLLGKLTGTSPELWMNLQARHDLWYAIRKAGKSRVQKIA